MQGEAAADGKSLPLHQNKEITYRWFLFLYELIGT
jgi:hypothetical protein